MALPLISTWAHSQPHLRLLPAAGVTGTDVMMFARGVPGNLKSIKDCMAIAKGFPESIKRIETELTASFEDVKKAIAAA